MGFNATWSMAVGGMVGGGIFSVLGVVVHVAAQWAWLSFVIAGVIALASAYSYARLTVHFGKGGGAFTFLREIHHEGFAGSLSWVLIIGYVLTISVYAYTFGHYLSFALALGPWFARVSGLAIIAVLVAVNLRGVGDSSRLEIITVWGKLLVLVGLAAYGITRWAPDQLTAGIQPTGPLAAVVGAATVFMAYEGFQLLSYDYDDIRDARRTLPRATITAVLSVILVYVVVALGATMLVGAGTLVEQEEVALAVAGEQILGLAGTIIVAIAAAFSTASAINATLFSTARLMEDVAERRDLPSLLSHENRARVPDHAILFIGGLGALLAAIGSLGTLVEVASLTFLFTFGAVNAIAFGRHVPHRWICLLGAAGAGGALAVSAWRMSHEAPWTLVAISLLIVLATVGRNAVVRRLPPQPQVR